MQHVPIDRISLKSKKSIEDDFSVMSFSMTRKAVLESICSSNTCFGNHVFSSAIERVFLTLDLFFDEKGSRLIIYLVDDMLLVCSLHKLNP